MALEIRLDVFEGPLDLLLHLIEKNKVDIYDIPISLITKQYLEYLDMMRSADMNVMSEFLLMAATLLDIKCRMLLPRPKNEEGAEEDPRSELVEQLLEYKVCRYMSSELRVMRRDAARSLFRKNSMPEELMNVRPPVDYEELLKGTTLAALSRIFRETMKRQEDKVDPIRSKFGRIEKEEISLKKKEEEVRSYARTHFVFSFRELIGSSSDRLEIIVSFLCVLELIKSGNFLAEQDEEGDDIRIIVREAA